MTTPKHAECGRSDGVVEQESGLPWYCMRCRVPFGAADGIVLPPPAPDVRRTLLDEVAVIRFLRSANDKGVIDGATGIKLLAYLQEWERGS